MSQRPIAAAAIVLVTLCLPPTAEGKDQSPRENLRASFAAVLDRSADRREDLAEALARAVDAWATGSNVAASDREQASELAESLRAMASSATRLVDLNDFTGLYAHLEVLVGPLAQRACVALQEVMQAELQGVLQAALAVNSTPANAKPVTFRGKTYRWSSHEGRAVLVEEGARHVAVRARAVESRPKVRTVTAEGPLIRWVPLGPSPQLGRSVVVPGLQTGDTIRVRGEVGVTNDVTTKRAGPGSVSYRDEHRYVLRVESQLRLGQEVGPEAGRRFASAKTKITPSNHHGQLLVQGETVVEPGDGDSIGMVIQAENAKGPSPSRVIKGKNNHAILPPGGMAALEVEDGVHKARLDVLVLSPGWEAEWSSQTLRSGPEHARKVTMRKDEQRHVALSFPLGRVEQGEVFDVATALIVMNHDRRAKQLCSAYLVLDASPDSLEGLRVSVMHGYNVPPRVESTVAKYVAFTAPTEMPQAWLKLVIFSESKGDKSHRLSVLSASRLEATRYTRR